LAQEKKIDLQQARGSGPGGRIQSTDVPSAKQHAAAAASQPIPAGLKVLKEIPMIGMRRAIAQNMQRSWQEAPQIIFQLDIEMDAAEGLRKLANENKIEGTPKISVTALLIKAAALTIKQNPIVNSQYTSEKVIVFEDINIGMAAAVENGLIVPVIRNVDKKGLVAISREVNDLAKRVREGKIMPDDLANGTFTISNLGMYGIDRFTAIVNPPQAAILAVGKMNRVFLPDADNQPALHMS
jgi:pyruvate dehydrogenase E2 component (dihydrolipoamide acetyltransferase)